MTPAIQTALYGLLNALGNPVTCDLFMPTHIQTLVYAALEQADVCAFIREWLEQDGSFAQFLQASEFLLRQLDQPVTLHDLASHMGMSIPTLQRRFKHYTADSPMQYLKKCASATLMLASRRLTAPCKAPLMQLAMKACRSSVVNLNAIMGRIHSRLSEFNTIIYSHAPAWECICSLWLTR